MSDYQIDPAILAIAPKIFPENGTRLQHLFEEQARNTPDAVAVSCQGNQLTYAELNQRANQLAHYLIRLGVGPNLLVALCFERSLDMIVSILAVLKAGGAYLPLDPACPEERLNFILTDAAAPVLLTDEKGVGLAKSPTISVSLTANAASIAFESVKNPVCDGTPDDLAYVIYTSGSTGQPKGVLVTHQNVIRLFTETESWFGFDANDVWSLFHSYAFDFSVWEIWGALLYGGKLAIVPFYVSRSPNDFYQFLAQERITILSQTPSAFRQLIRAEASSDTRQDLDLRCVIFGGEALELQSLKPWFERHGDRKPRLINMYGITETTVHVTYRPIQQADLDKNCGSVIGVPIPDLQLHLLDQNLNSVPAGVAGEIFVGGAGVARGYLNRPELTAERFIPDPFTSKAGARLYRSGDLARRHPNGELEYLGRIDEQVKIRGFRIEIGEIQAALNRHPAVRESAVIASDAANAEKRLIAYVVIDRAVSVTDLRHFLGRTLPDYMVPSSFEFLESLPLTTNGKLDRKALPFPEQARPTIETKFIAPGTPIETALATIWSELFHLERVGTADNFFELGGHSLIAVQMMIRIREQLGVELPLQVLSETPTIASLAEAIVQQLLGDANADEMETVLTHLTQMSEEDARTLLASDF